MKKSYLFLNHVVLPVKFLRNLTVWTGNKTGIQFAICAATFNSGKVFRGVQGNPYRGYPNEPADMFLDI